MENAPSEEKGPPFDPELEIWRLKRQFKQLEDDIDEIRKDVRANRSRFYRMQATLRGEEEEPEEEERAPKATPFSLEGLEPGTSLKHLLER